MVKPLSPADRQSTLDCLAGLSTGQKKLAALDLALDLIIDIAQKALDGVEPNDREEKLLRTANRAISSYDFSLIQQHLGKLTAVLERVFDV